MNIKIFVVGRIVLYSVSNVVETLTPLDIKGKLKLSLILFDSTLLLFGFVIFTDVLFEEEEFKPFILSTKLLNSSFIYKL